MFTQDQVDALESLGEQGISLNNCGAVLGITRKSFLRFYEDSEEAQLSYEKGQAILEVKTKAILEKKKDEDYKYFEYYATNVVGLKVDPKDKKIQVKEDKPVFDRDKDKLSNPLLLLDD